MKLIKGADEFQKEIAALKIQLAWRKCIRRKLLQSLNPNKRQLQIWDQEVMALKQRTLVRQIYSEHIDVPFWHPFLLPPDRPSWTKLTPSPAALSYNFAVDHYCPVVAKQGSMPSPLLDEKGQIKESFGDMVNYTNHALKESVTLTK